MLVLCLPQQSVQCPYVSGKERETPATDPRDRLIALQKLGGR